MSRWRARLEKYDIRAPFDGTLGLREVDIGAYLAAGDDERAGAAIIMAEPAPMRAAKTNFLKIPPSGYFHYGTTGGRTTTPSMSRAP